ncbi:hypothetical protein HZA38_05315 [Candidatus Peregrinibacteria bacterium]|nr:hypothetical protein [Candidatus Peregrinibacteria bacterium]
MKGVTEDVAITLRKKRHQIEGLTRLVRENIARRAFEKTADSWEIHETALSVLEEQRAKILKILENRYDVTRKERSSSTSATNDGRKKEYSWDYKPKDPKDPPQRGKPLKQEDINKMGEAEKLNMLGQRPWYALVAHGKAVWDKKDIIGLNADKKRKSTGPYLYKRQAQALEGAIHILKNRVRREKSIFENRASTGKYNVAFSLLTDNYKLPPETAQKYLKHVIDHKSLSNEFKTYLTGKPDLPQPEEVEEILKNTLVGSFGVRWLREKLGIERGKVGFRAKEVETNMNAKNKGNDYTKRSTEIAAHLQSELDASLKTTPGSLQVGKEFFFEFGENLRTKFKSDTGANISDFQRMEVTFLDQKNNQIVFKTLGIPEKKVTINTRDGIFEYDGKTFPLSILKGNPEPVGMGKKGEEALQNKEAARRFRDKFFDKITTSAISTKRINVDFTINSSTGKKDKKKFLEAIGSSETDTSFSLELQSFNKDNAIFSINVSGQKKSIKLDFKNGSLVCKGNKLDVRHIEKLTIS